MNSKVKLLYHFSFQKTGILTYAIFFAKIKKNYKFILKNKKKMPILVIICNFKYLN